MAVDLEVPGHVAKHFGHALAHVAQIGAATPLADIGWSVNDIAARKLLRQLAAPLLLALRVLGRRRVGVRRFRFWPLRLRCDRFGLRGLGFLQRQLELFECTVDALGTRAELLTPELGDLCFELLDRQLRDDETVLRRRKLDRKSTRLNSSH